MFSLLKDKLVLDIITDENVLFFWSMLAVNWCDDEADLLLTMIAEEWVTLRGFSFTSAWMENFKQSTKTSVQKSKGTRKKLAVSKSKKAKPTPAVDRSKSTCTGVALRRSNRKGQNSEEIK